MAASNRKSARKGAVVVLVAFSMAVILAFVAISVDGGGLLDLRRKSQATADAAALAAAESLFREYPSNNGFDDGSAAQAALTIAALNGFENDNTTSTVTVRTSPDRYSGGENVGDIIPPGNAEVTVNYNQPRYFSRILGSESIPVGARAVATGSWEAAFVAIHVLDLHRSSALKVTGESLTNITNARVIVNSDAADAGTTNGGTISAPTFNITGGTSVTGGKGGFFGDINYGTPPEPDPLRHIPEPLPGVPEAQVKFSNGEVTIGPGTYSGGISVSGKGSLSMLPGVYYMDGGGFSFSGQGNLTAEGVMIFNAPTKSSDVISITGTGDVVMSPPIDGIYKGLTLFQARASGNDLKISGGGNMDVTGTFYAAGGTLNVQGGGDSQIGSQYVSRFLEIGGNGSLRIDYDPDGAIPVRVLHLVE